MCSAGGSSDHSATFTHHYLLAHSELPSGRILDYGCGHGRGALLLARADRSVLAIDPDSKAIRKALKLESSGLVEFQVQQGFTIPAPDMSFDGAVSFEVIEHLATKSQRLYLSELKRVLKPGGKLLLSTPNRRVIEPYYIGNVSPINSTHVAELYPEELKAMLIEWIHVDSLRVFHAVDLKRRRLALEYQKSFPIGPSVRALVPLSIRSLWLRVRKRGPPEDWTFSQVTWDELVAGRNLFFEDVLVSGRVMPDPSRPRAA